MEMTERKKKILRAIVDSYIRTAEPVGSKAIASLPDINTSSATVRNEMSDLTEMGYLEQPHTSAGRVPSPAGYRLYIDELMQDYRLSVDETQAMHQTLEGKIREFDDVIAQVSKIVSKMTNLPAYAVTSPKVQPTVKKFELIMAESGTFILVVMGISTTFAVLSPCEGQVAHALLTRPPLKHTPSIPSENFLSVVCLRSTCMC